MKQYLLSGAMNLFISRESEGVAHNFPMSISGPNSATNGIDMIINGSTPYFSSIPLSIEGIGQSNQSVKIV